MRLSRAVLDPGVIPRRYVPPTVLRYLESVGETHKVRKGYTLFETLARLPGQGVGMRIYQKKWEQAGMPVDRQGGTYWHVAKTEFDTRSRRAPDSIKRAWGIKYWKGRQATPPHTIVEIPDADQIWLVVDEVPGGQASTTFYVNQQLGPLTTPEFGTDPATAAVVDASETVRRPGEGDT